MLVPISPYGLSVDTSNRVHKVLSMKDSLMIKANIFMNGPVMLGSDELVVERLQC